MYLWQDSSFLFGEQGNDAFMKVTTSNFGKFYFGILGRATCLVPMNSYTEDFFNAEAQRTQRFFTLYV